MAFERLDPNSEKILKIFQKHDTLNIPQLNVLISQDPFTYAGYFCILLKKKYIINTDINKRNSEILECSDTYSITTSGKIYFDLKKQDFHQFLKRSIFIPATSSIITSLTVTLITLWLKGLLK